MPELPEVETIVNDLKGILIGARFKSVEIFNERSVAGEIELFGKLEGKQVLKIERRGKFINIFFENDWTSDFE